jgi:NifU-like protein involved in Fe-S cluster formation
MALTLKVTVLSKWGFLYLKTNNYLWKGVLEMMYTEEVEKMICVAKGPNHGAAPIPQEGKWTQSKEIKDISGLTHGVGWCAPQQGACKLTLNVKDGIIQEALVETIGCSGMTHSAAMSAEILPGKTILEALNTDLVCDAINTAMRELFLQIAYGRTQTAFSEGGLPIGAGLEDLGKGLRSQVGTMYGTLDKGPRYLEMAEGYCTHVALDVNNEIIGYEFVHLGKMMDMIKKGIEAAEALKKATSKYGRYDEAVKIIDPRHE